MTREQIQEIKDADSLQQALRKIAKERTYKVGDKTFNVTDAIAQYNPNTHKVNDPKERRDKILAGEGEDIFDSINQETRPTSEYEIAKVNRLPLPTQKRIVLTSATFLVGERINLEAVSENSTDETLEGLIRKVWRDNKLDYKNKEIAKLMMSETHCAELWYDYPSESYWKGTAIKDSKKRVGVRILAESKGDKLYPVFDEYDDLIAFGRGYETKGEIDESVEHFDLYTEDKIIKGTKRAGEWAYEEKANPFGAIPVIYYSQDAPEWADVQQLIERKETRFSDFADTNDYFADPALISKGVVENLPSKGEVGKQFQVTGDGDVSYLTWDSAPEATKLEFQLLDNEISAGSHCPNITFESMKTLAGNIAGITLKLLFLDAQIKASDKQEQFGQLIQRRINLLKRIVVSLHPALLENNTLEMYPIFTPFMPVNDVEHNELLMQAYEKGMISRKTMLAKSTLVNNADEEEQEIDKDQERKNKLAQAQANTQKDEKKV